MSETFVRSPASPQERPKYLPEIEAFLDMPKVRHDLGSTALGDMMTGASFNTLETSANFQGSWTNVALARMQSVDFRTKFTHWVQTSVTALPEILTPMAREKITAAQYTTRIDEFDRAHENVSSYVTYSPAAEYGVTANKHGTSPGFGENAVLFSDAQLDNRQKDIIVAHEMYHSLVDSQGSAAKRTVLEAFNTDEITLWNQEQKNSNSDKRTPIKYMTSPDELMARMAQLKNYFGMQDNESFTQEHLDYARSHYVEDTQLDNNMTLFFRMAIDEAFISKMNTLPI